MNTLTTIALNAWDSIHDSFGMLWSKVFGVVPDIGVAVVVLAIGLTIASLISDKVGVILRKSKVGEILDSVVIKPVSALTGVKINATHTLVLSVRWFLIATVVLAALDLAKMHKVIDFFHSVLAYLPNLIVAALIVAVGSMIAKLAASLVSAITKKDNMSHIAGVAVKVFAYIAALSHLATPLVSSFSGFVGDLGLSKLQADALFIGVILLVLLGSKKAVTTTVSGLIKAGK